VKTFLLKHIKDPYREKMRNAIEKRIDSYSKSIVKASSGLMHLAREMYREVTHMETVEVPGRRFRCDVYSSADAWYRVSAGENEPVHALHENLAEFRLESNR